MVRPRRGGPATPRRPGPGILSEGATVLSPIIWLIALAVVFVIIDEGQRLRRRVKAVEDRLDSLEHGGRDRTPDGGLPS